MNYSLTIAGIIVAVLGRLGQNVGVHTDSVTVENLQVVLTVGMQVVGVVLAYIGRIRHGDITLWGQKTVANGTEMPPQ
jgi:hypothetical protein